MGVIGGTLNWLTDSGEDQTTLTQWGAGLVVILILAFVWATVVKQVIS